MDDVIVDFPWCIDASSFAVSYGLYIFSIFMNVLVLEKSYVLPVSLFPSANTCYDDMVNLRVPNAPHDDDAHLLMDHTTTIQARDLKYNTYCFHSPLLKRQLSKS